MRRAKLKRRVKKLSLPARESTKKMKRAMMKRDCTKKSSRSPSLQES